MRIDSSRSEKLLSAAEAGLFARSGLESNDTTPGLAMVCTDQIHKTRGECRRDATEQSQSSSIPETQDADLREGAWPAAAPQDWDATDADGDVGDVNLTDSLPQSHDPSVEVDIAPPRRKMDSTQSTQSNAGRSYDRYFHPVSPVPTSSSTRAPRSAKPAITSSPERGVLNNHDTGAVRFDFPNAAGTNKIVSPGQDDSGFVDFGSLTHFPHVGSQMPDQSPPEKFPETPGPPQNPFRHSRSQLLPTSQLFRGTQFSSPIKLASPTSSRPSPADFHGNSISPNPVISSPLKARGLRSSPTVVPTSSPDILPGTTSSRLNDRASSPVNTGSTRNPLVPESSHDDLPRKRSIPEPMSTYEPMRKSQERRSTSEVRSDPVSSGEDDDRYDSMARRMKVKSKKEAALKQLTAINFPRPLRPDDVEVPSTSQRRRPSQAEEYIAQCHGTNVAEHTSGGTDAVREPQEGPLHIVQDHVGDEDSTQSDVEEEAAPVAEPTPSTAPELPRSSTISADHLVQNSGIEGMSNGDAIPETSPTGRRPEVGVEEAPVVEPPVFPKLTPNFPSSPPAFSTRSRKARAGTVSEREPSSTSTLSNLTSTPQLPSSNPVTTITGPTGSPTGSTIVASSSPALAQTKRRDVRHKASKLKTASTESLRHSTRLGRRGSSSTDELSRSLSATPTFEQSLRASRLFVPRSTSRPGRAAMKLLPTQRDQKLFESMAFAISFQSRKPGESNEQYNGRMDFSTMVQKRVKQAGGRILENGFDELFEALPMGTPSSSPASTPGAEPEINLTPEGCSTGFTALIADGHSRKVKYMQALALGLPCVATRWVTACLDRNELVDWTPYLLCAGQSAFLGDAIRSRSLSPYNASTARLPDIISQRAKLLEGSRILAVVKKALEGRKMAYVFLARVLGASLTRVYSIEEAKVEMKAAEDSGSPFDWVYVGGKPDEDALFATDPVGGKKRKRATTATSFAAERPLKRIRTLSDELVIQSLILGRLIEDGEMGE